MPKAVSARPVFFVGALLASLALLASCSPAFRTGFRGELRGRAENATELSVPASAREVILEGAIRLNSGAALLILEDPEGREAFRDEPASSAVPELEIGPERFAAAPGIWRLRLAGLSAETEGSYDLSLEVLR